MRHLAVEAGFAFAGPGWGLRAHRLERVPGCCCFVDHTSGKLSKRGRLNLIRPFEEAFQQKQDPCLLQLNDFPASPTLTWKAPCSLITRPSEHFV